MKKWDLQGKRALITGATKGIGKAIADEFLGLGAEVMIVARDEKEVNRLVKLWQAEGKTVTGVAGDITSAADRQRISDTIAERWSALDVLVNNAGMNIRRKLADYTEEEYRSVLELNLFGAVEMCRLCLPYLQRGQSPNVVNIASVAGSVDVLTGAPYGMSKAALIQLSRNLAAEWAEHGIRVNSVSPGYTDTPLTASVLRQPERLQRIKDSTFMNRVAEADEIANVAAFLAMDKASYVTGQNFVVDGGMLAKGL